MTNKELLNLIDERNSGNYSNCIELYKYLKDSNMLSVYYLLELYFEDKSRLIVPTNVGFADILASNNIKAARYVYLYDIIINHKKYSFCTDIFTAEVGIWFENKWEKLLKADKKVKYAFFLEASDHRDKDKKKKVDKLVDKALNTENNTKKEKLLLKATNYDDAYPVYELAKFYYENGNKNLGLEYYQKAFEMHYVDAGLFLADYYHNKNKVDKEIEYLSKSIRKNDYKITYRLLKLLQKHNKSLELVYSLLEWHVYRNECLCYELAKLYETGEFVEKDELSAYFLYMCARDYLDSKDKVNELKEKLKVVYKAKSQEIFDSIIAKIEEKNALKAQERKAKALAEKAKEAELKRLKELESIHKELRLDKKAKTLNGTVESEKLFKKALSINNIEKVVEILELAAEEGNENAAYSLIYYYYNKDEIKFEEYFKQVLNSNITFQMIDNLNDNFEISQELFNKLDEQAKDLKRYVIEFLYRYCYSRKKYKKAKEYAYLNALAGEPYLLVKNYIKKITEDTNFEYVNVLLMEENLNNVYAVLCLYDVLIDEELRQYFNIPSDIKAVDLLHSVENVKNKKIRLEVYDKLGECYEKGIGTPKDLVKARDYYYDSGNSKKWNQMLNEISNIKYYKRIKQEQTESLTSLYPCPELDKWVNMGSTKAKNIVKRYGEIDRSEAIKDMIARDKLLKLGFTLDEMHDDLGNFIGYKLEKEIQKRVQEKYPTPVISNNTKQVIKVEKELEPIDNNIKFVLFGKLDSDPYDPDKNGSTFHRFFSSAFLTDGYRKRKENYERLFNDMEGFYVEELIIDGQKINRTDFYNHLTLTLEPGLHSVSATIYLKLHYSGYKLSDYARNRPVGDFDYYPDNSKKDSWKRYRKTLTINDFEVLPGKVYYLAFWATVYGEWHRVYDGFTKMFVGSELKKVVSEFSFDFMTESQVKRKGNFYSIDEENFINIEDIGKYIYSPHERKM